MLQAGCSVWSLCAAVARRAAADGGRTRDTRLADILRASGPWRSDMPHRHSPVASNHFPGVTHGAVRTLAHGADTIACHIAVDYTAEEEDDPTAGLWWVLLT